MLGDIQPHMEAAWGIRATMTEVPIHRLVAQDLYGFAGTQVCRIIVRNFPQH